MLYTANTWFLHKTETLPLLWANTNSVLKILLFETANKAPPKNTQCTGNKYISTKTREMQSILKSGVRCT